MKKSIPLFVVIFLLISNSPMGKEVVQQDWNQGPGTSGPVTEWGSSFLESSEINYFYYQGRLSLTIARGDPQMHHIANMPSFLDKKIEIGDIGGIPGDTGSGDIPTPALDVVIAGADGIIWYPNDGTGDFSRGIQIYPAKPVVSFDLIDFNGNGFIDAVISDFDLGKIYVYANDGDGNFSKYAEVGSQGGVHQVAAADFDNDGDIDVVATHHHNPPFSRPYDLAHWYENVDYGQDFIPHYLGLIGEASRRIHTGDLDGDGDVDFITSAHHGTYWLENVINEKGPEWAFEKHTVQDSTRKNLYDWIGDVNKDGYLDILAANLDEPPTYPQWWENDGSGNFAEHVLVGFTNPEGIVSIDIDYDGDIDIIQSYFGPGYAGSDNGKDGFIGWYENLGDDSFHFRKFDNYPQSCDLQVADISGNGFLDLVTSTHALGVTTDWWELFDHFKPEGELVSSIFDAGEPSRWQEIDWEIDSVKNTTVEFQVRTTSDLGTWPEWKDCEVLLAPGSIETCVEQNTRYVQYKLLMSTQDPDYSPLLYKVSITYDDAGDITEEPVLSSADLKVLGSEVHYSIPGNQSASLSIFDVSGRAMQKLELCGSGSLDISHYPQGVYFIRLEHQALTSIRKTVLIRQ